MMLSFAARTSRVMTHPRRPSSQTSVPLKYITILGVRVRGEEATVWMLTNDRPPFEEYTCVCFREGGRWTEAYGSNGLAHPVPAEVQAEAARVRARFA